MTWWQYSSQLTIHSSDAAAVSSFCPSVRRTKKSYTSSDVIHTQVTIKWHLSNCIAFLFKETKIDFELNSMLLITYPMPNIMRGPKQAMTLTITIHINTNLSFLAFRLYSNVDSGRSWFVVQSWRTALQNGNLLEECPSWRDEFFFPCKMTWFAHQWWSFARTLGYFVCCSGHLCLSSIVPLRPLVGLRPPSNSFIMSFRLTMPVTSLPGAVQDTTPEDALSSCWCSHSNTHHLIRHMV
jgi:hypothetical protein